MEQLRLSKEFFILDALELAPLLLGCTIVRRVEQGQERFIINEVEVYKGKDDLACHASKGRTPRTETMFAKGGTLYVYLIYGMHWMLNIVTGGEDDPQAILIRGVQGCNGPGRLTKRLKVDGSYNREDICTSERIWIEQPKIKCQHMERTPRIGIDYAGPYWSKVPWRFLAPNLGAKM